MFFFLRRLFQAADELLGLRFADAHERGWIIFSIRNIFCRPVKTIGHVEFLAVGSRQPVRIREAFWQLRGEDQRERTVVAELQRRLLVEQITVQRIWYDLEID